MSNTLIETSSGTFVDLANPQVKDIHLDDIIMALSNISRFGGHTEIHYSVAQHSIHVMELVKAAQNTNSYYFWEFHNYRKFMNLQDVFYEGNHYVNQMVALTHDFSEAYLSDLPSPVKSLPGMREAYNAAEEKINIVMFAALGLNFSPEDWANAHIITKWADLQALRIEGHFFAKSKGETWNLPVELPPIEEMTNFEIKSFEDDGDYNKLRRKYFYLFGKVNN